MRPTFFRQPHRLMLHVQMEMCCQMMPKRGKSDFSTRISHDSLDFLFSVDDHAFVLVACPYVGLDWRGCANILFTVDEPLDDRGNISVLFKLI